MPNIISQIIEIDMIAQRRLDDANKIKAQYNVELNEKKAQTAKALDDKTKYRIEQILLNEQKLAQEEKAVIKSQTDTAINRLEDIFNQTHEKLEQDIFNNVISIQSKQRSSYLC